MKYTKDVLEKAVANNVSLASTIRSLGKRVSGGNYQHIQAKIKQYGIDTTHFLGNKTCAGYRNPAVTRSKRPASEILVCGKDEREKSIALRRALREIERPYVCAKCGGGPEWHGARLVLEIHHKNGDRHDDRQENLDFLCPNCHSQCEKSGRSALRVVHLCECGNRRGNKAKQCRSCANADRPTKIDWPTDAELIRMVSETSRFAASKRLGVSFAAVAKRLNRVKDSESLGMGRPTAFEAQQPETVCEFNSRALLLYGR